VIEPASLGRPIVIGPHYHKARQVVDDFRTRNAIQVADSPAGVIERIRALKADPERARELGARARRAVDENLGATDRTLEALGHHMPDVA
jgi:3-deoxy-D-manno-octulosonic-acid transferase